MQRRCKMNASILIFGDVLRTILRTDYVRRIPLASEKIDSVRLKNASRSDERTVRRAWRNARQHGAAHGIDRWESTPPDRTSPA